MSLTLSLEDYAKALASLAAPQRHLESVAMSSVQHPLLRARWPDLEADLAAMGREHVPLQASPPALNTPSAVLGALYVVEGSCLGAEFIARAVRTRLHPVPPCRFFACAGGQPRWHAFWSWVETRAECIDLAAAESGAVDTFGFYLKHLDGCMAKSDIPPTTATPR